MIDHRPDEYEAETRREDKPPRVQRGGSQFVRRCSLASVLALLALLMGAATALADSASISVTNTAGQSDPAAGVPRVFTISGVASVPEKLFLKYRSPGGAPCAPSAESDSGSTLSQGQQEGAFDFAYDSPVNGAFNLQQVYNWGPPGTFVFCAWLASSENAITTPVTQTITFRSPTGTITATLNPTTPTPGQQTTVTVTGSSESPAKVFAKIRPAGGAGCALTYEADSGENLINNDSVNGSFSTQATTIQSKAGQYLLCLWLAESTTDTSPIAGPQPVTFTVALPPPPPPPPPPAPSTQCLRDRAGVAHQELVIRSYARRLKSHHLSRKTRRRDMKILVGARKSASKYQSLRQHQCPNGR
jgi:hypothetical protein